MDARVLAGAFIAFGAMLFTLVMTGSDLGFGLTRWIGGIAFSLGLILIIAGGSGFGALTFWVVYLRG